MKFIILQKLYP